MLTKFWSLFYKPNTGFMAGLKFILIKNQIIDVNQIGVITFNKQSETKPPEILISNLYGNIIAGVTCKDDKEIESYKEQLEFIFLKKRA